MAETLINEPVLLDTDVLIDYLNGKDHARQQILAISADRCLLSDITVMELYAGSIDKKEYQAFEKNLRDFTVIHLSSMTSMEAMKLVKEYCLSHSVDVPDMLNAALSLEYGLTLFTYNIKDYKHIPAIRLYANYRKV